MHWMSSKQKLIAELHPKQNNAVHHLLLQWMRSSGSKVTKMKILIDTFVSKRSKAKYRLKTKYLNSFQIQPSTIRARVCATDPKDCTRITADPNSRRPRS